MKKVFKKNYKIILLFLLFIVFFSFSVVVTWDSSHYMSYVNIFKGNIPFSSWDIVRGPIFPFIIYFGISLFGETIQGLLLLFFLFYIFYSYIVYLVFSKIFKNNFFRWFFILFCVLNPIIFGYFHTLLTEFVIITISLLSCYLAYLWWYEKNEKKRNLISLYFVFALAFVWHLKQPYICCVLFPMVISVCVNIYKKHTFKNIKYYGGVCLLSILVMLLSIVTWKSILVYKGVNMNTGRDSSNLLSKQILNGVQYFKYDESFDFVNYQDDEFLSETEKEFISKYLNDKKNNLKIINIYNHNNLIDKDVIKVNAYGIPSSGDAILQVIKTFFKHPDIIVKNYIKNYCALSSFCNIKSADGVNYYVDEKVNFIHLYENELIGYRIFQSNIENRFYLSEDGAALTSNFAQENRPSWFFSLFFKLLQIPTNIIFKLTILLLPFALVSLILYKIIKKKSIKHYSLYIMSLIFLGYSFFTVLANAFSGSIIDRYAINSFIPGLIGIVSFVTLIVKNKVKKE